MAVVRTSLGNVEQWSPAQTLVPALIWPRWGVFHISVPHCIYSVPPHSCQTPFPATLHSGKWALCFSLWCLALASDLLLTSSTDVLHCHATPAVPPHASAIFAFHISQFSSVPEVVCLPSIHHLQSQCHLPAIEHNTSLTLHPFLPSFVYLACIGCMYNNNMLTWSPFFLFPIIWNVILDFPDLLHFWVGK